MWVGKFHRNTGDDNILSLNDNHIYLIIIVALINKVFSFTLGTVLFLMSYSGQETGTRLRLMAIW